MMVLLNCSIPIPPSLNNSYIASRRGGRFPSKRLIAWQRAAQESLLSSRCAAAPPGSRVRIELELKTGKGWIVTRDPDNIIKHTVDSLVDAGILEGDTVQFVAVVSITATLPEHKNQLASLMVRVSIDQQKETNGRAKEEAEGEASQSTIQEEEGGYYEAPEEGAILGNSRERYHWSG